MNKRIVGMFIAVCLTFSVFNIQIAFAKEDYSQSIVLLQGLSIGQITDENKVMTRGEFAKCLSDILNYDDRPQNVNGEFSDVTQKHDYSGAVYSLVMQKIISGYSDGTFRPNNGITLEQAVKMLLSAMGYDVIAQKEGGFPSGYMKIAYKLHLLDDVKIQNTEKMLSGEIAQLLANALDTQVLLATDFSAYGEGYETRENETLLSVRAGIKKVIGVVSDNGVSSLTGNSKIAENHICINSIIYNEGNTKACDYLGYKVEAYIHKDDYDNEKVIFIKYAKNISITHIDAYRLVPAHSSFSATNVVYKNIDEKTVNARVDQGADFIYNGVAYTDLRVADLKISDGNLILVDNNGDGISEIVFVNNARTIIVSGVSSVPQKVYDMTGGLPLLLEPKKTVTIFKNGKEATLSELCEWDVVNAFVSRDGKNITLEATDRRINGTVTGHSKEAEVIEINGEYYKVKKPEIFNLIKLGEQYEFCLSTESDIVMIKGSAKDDVKVAYYVKSAIKSGLNSKLQIQLFTVDGEHTVFELADKAKIDGDKNKTTQEMQSYLQTNATGKLLEYKLNENGLISEIVLPYVGAELPDNEAGRLHLCFDSSDTEIAYFINQRSFQGKVILSDRAEVFQIPTNAQAEEDYSVKTPGFFKNEHPYKIEAYSVGTEDGTADFVVLVADSQPDYSASVDPFVVTGIKYARDKEGEMRETVCGYNYQGDVLYFAETDGLFTNAGLKSGDIVRCPINIQGRAVEARKVYDAQLKRIVSTEEEGKRYWDECRSFSGNVYSKYGTILGITTADISSSSADVIKDSLEWHDLNNVKIYCVDSQRDEKVEEITISEIFDYTNTKTEYSKVYMYSDKSNPRMLVVYR